MTPEIRAFEFALGLFSVLIGLAVADIATSFHRLVRGKSAVRWDPLALLAALYALLMAIGMWFDLWGIRDVTSTRHFVLYLCLIVQLFVLFLVAAASLPDEPGHEIDLRQYYAGNRRYFWSLVAIYQAIYFAFGLYFVGALLSRMPRGLAIGFLVQMIALVALPLALVVLRSRLAHYVVLGVLFTVNVWHYAHYSIA